MKKTSLKVVFFGNEKLATGIANVRPVIHEAVETAGFEIEQAITGKLKELRPHEADLAVLAAYGHIIPQSVLDQFRSGIINVHPSLLPAYRGPTPIEQAILDGAAKTGVSIMLLTAGMDEGPLYKQKALRLNGRETKAELAEKLQKLGAELLIDVLPAIAYGDLKPYKQPHPNRATYSRLLAKEDGVIDWNKAAAQIEREIRAFASWPNSRTIMAGKEVIITKASVISGKDKPGSVTIIDGELLVYCGQDSLSIETLKPSAGREMTAREFMAGYKQFL